MDSSILDFFLKGDTSLEAVGQECPVTWLASSGWKDLLCLSNLNPVCSELLKDFTADSSEWNTWYNLETPEMVPMPHGYTERIDPLVALCVMRCLRPDRLLTT